MRQPGHTRMSPAPNLIREEWLASSRGTHRTVRTPGRPLGAYTRFRSSSQRTDADSCGSARPHSSMAEPPFDLLAGGRVVHSCYGRSRWVNQCVIPTLMRSPTYSRSLT
jgi:hypothetical protein